MFNDLRLFGFIPENHTKHYSHNNCHKESDSIILRISPVGPILFPEISFALNKKRLGIFGWEVQVLGIWYWGTELLNKFLIPPEESLEKTIVLQRQNS